ncbi:hypothetical protein F5Y16DRAFT_404452 [Xylariaceae sp. FL0255]|nr:hypothetical protein F5Y16DRAFT_404452 [Xylariaceae sp. FL0255]
MPQSSPAIKMSKMVDIGYNKLEEQPESLGEDFEKSPHHGQYEGHDQAHFTRTRYLTSWWAFCGHLLLVICYTSITLTVLHRASVPSSGLADFDKFEYEPLKPLMKYQRRYFDLELGKASQYSGRGPEVDEAWLAISALPGQVGTIKMSKEELHAMNLSSTALADGSGYAVTIDVFHQLHCLNFLRKSIINTTANSPLWQEHVDHCLDSLRLSIQCHSDTSFLTYKWLKNYAKPWPDFRSFHTCRDFDGIREFALSRWFDATQPGLVVHPEMGPVNFSDQHHKGGVPLRPYEFLDIE